ncbi:putative bifunctional diguanylate cyclase/phosphodiesterase [Paractinoplanes atraurantiacus]|uniref:PAS domain S-box-containing protein/diguanylate cyclase (GGDEF) domain-containing protein n=1 Tax=Paractinoplanes atraurantiacus TaxID=1036182 RepID=A0A285K3X2_9ACTN|nr:bifunctional diguanylate cyclase/phosphodiesterase [Actinoplanes atraurantiacus]SNY66031.1 PAS domain S-box-containing protein/diguanylate cyclase (GGDEF) domain-containing protein [Actinoplanes atraurantiacus]
MSFVELWRRQLVAAGFVPLDAGQLDELLSSLAARLRAGDGESVGAALVEAHLTDPAMLAATVEVIGDQKVAARVAAGYAQAIRAATMADQEELNQAVVRALRASEARLRAVFDNAAIGIGVSAMDGRIVQVNQAFADLLGYTREQMCHLLVPELTHPEDPRDMWRMYEGVINGDVDHVRMEKAYYRKDGGEIWTDLTVSLIRDDDGAPEFTIAMVQDITDRRRLKKRLEHQATHDPLTGLPNRTKIASDLVRIFRDNASVGVCYLDLDGFKRINDTLGHQVGDELLAAVAKRLERSTNHVAGRMGGDEFVVLVEDPRNMRELAESLLTELSRPYVIRKHRLRISASIGVVESEVAATNPQELMKAADLTLYAAKSDGRGRFVMYDSERDARQAARYALAAELPDALDRREFTLVYQPLVSLEDRELRGVEALVRWDHPRLGRLSPDAFIPLAEETGVILPLGRWVLEQACAQASEWAKEFPDRRVAMSVNMTVSQAHDPGLLADVDGILMRTGWDPALLVLELTESAVMDPDGTASLNGLAERGIRIAIDDFGTGYSNLAYLRRLPVHVLKLAGPFVEGLRDSEGESDSVDERIVETIIKLAHAIGISVTAEAVETAPQEAALRQLGCDTGQGWLFSRPLSSSGVTELLVKSFSSSSADV